MKTGFGVAICAAMSLILYSVCGAQANDPKTLTATAEIEKVVLFKNGLVFVVSNYTMPGEARTVTIGQLPIPTLGTFWVSYGPDVKMKSLTSLMDEFESETPVQSIGQLVQLNAGKKVLLHTSDRDIEGIIQPDPVMKTHPETMNPYFMSPPQARDPGSIYSMPPSNVLYVKTDKGTVALNPGLILRAEFAEGEPLRTTHEKRHLPTIRMDLEKPAGGEKVTVSYLARGMTWVPAYLIDLSDPKTARFSAHAIVINEMMDLNNVNVELVTGFPNIRFSGTSSPVAKSEDLATFLQSLSSGNSRRNNLDNMLMQQAIVVNAPSVYGGEAGGISPGYSTAAEGEVAEDLFFYPAKRLTLKRDETLWLPLFSSEMPYKHIYTWKIADFVDNQDHYQAVRPDQPQGEEIWHSCRLTNTLNMPLTTASTEFVTNNEITGQDVCYYTPPKAETTIRINKALNITAEKGENEVDRKRDATIIHGYHYDLVKVQGELRIRNRLTKDVNVEITKELSGEVLDKGPNSTDTKTAEGLKQVNPKHILTWSIDLKPGEQRKVVYVYQVYIRD
jgi:hypothetical protein